ELDRDYLQSSLAANVDDTLSGDHCRIVASAAQQGLKPARPHPDQKVRGEAVSMDFKARAEKFFAE
ncbi:MAG TPA: hypothetical protein VKR28_01125, partial [Candidatus Binatus sp.]|nr:hypothetical protein [Candidatus Binatus sp.]